MGNLPTPTMLLMFRFLAVFLSFLMTLNGFSRGGTTFLGHTSTFIIKSSINDTSDAYSLLYHGVEYIKDLSNIKGNPLFPSDKYRGSVKYHGNWYRDIEITYDCEDELIIIRDMHDLLRLQLINEKLDEFYIDQHHFVKANLNDEGYKFYELIFDGKRKLLVKWTKTRSVDSKSEDSYVMQRTLWVIDKELLLNVTQKNEIFILASKNKGEIKRAIAKQNIKFKKDPINYAAAVLKVMEEKGW